MVSETYLYIEHFDRLLEKMADIHHKSNARQFSSKDSESRKKLRRFIFWCVISGLEPSDRLFVEVSEAKSKCAEKARKSVVNRFLLPDYKSSETTSDRQRISEGCMKESSLYYSQITNGKLCIGRNGDKSIIDSSTDDKLSVEKSTRLDGLIHWKSVRFSHSVVHCDEKKAMFSTADSPSMRRYISPFKDVKVNCMHAYGEMPSFVMDKCLLESNPHRVKMDISEMDVNDVHMNGDLSFNSSCDQASYCEEEMRILNCDNFNQWGNFYPKDSCHNTVQSCEESYCSFGIQIGKSKVFSTCKVQHRNSLKKAEKQPAPGIGKTPLTPKGSAMLPNNFPLSINNINQFKKESDKPMETTSIEKPVSCLVSRRQTLTFDSETSKVTNTPAKHKVLPCKTPNHDVIHSFQNGLDFSEDYSRSELMTTKPEKNSRLVIETENSQQIPNFFDPGNFNNSQKPLETIFNSEARVDSISNFLIPRSASQMVPQSPFHFQLSTPKFEECSPTYLFHSELSYPSSAYSNPDIQTPSKEIMKLSDVCSYSCLQGRAVEIGGNVIPMNLSITPSFLTSPFTRAYCSDFHDGECVEVHR